MGVIVFIGSLSDEFFDSAIARVHEDFLDRIFSRNDIGAEYSIDSSIQEFLCDGLTDDQSVLVMAEYVGMKIPAHVRDRVVARDGEYRLDPSIFSSQAGAMYEAYTRPADVLPYTPASVLRR